MTVKEAAALFGVTDTSVLNWEIRDEIPEAGKMEKIKEFLQLVHH